MNELKPRKKNDFAQNNSVNTKCTKYLHCNQSNVSLEMRSLAQHTEYFAIGSCGENEQMCMSYIVYVYIYVWRMTLTHFPHGSMYANKHINSCFSFIVQPRSLIQSRKSFERMSENIENE